MADGAAPNEHFRYLAHFNRRLDSGENVDLFESVLKGQGIDDRGQHAHVVGRNAVKTLCAGSESSKNISPADDNGDLNSEAMDLFDFVGDAKNDLGVDAEALISHQSFATEFQENSLVLGRVF